MDDAPERGAPSNVRGWLSEVYLPALVSAQAEQLVRRLGGRATVDDPIFGRTTGMPALAGYLERAAAWFTAREGVFEVLAFTTGSDRDVTEGTLGLMVDGKRVSVPVAVVAERRPEREVEIRVYYSTRLILGKPTARAPLVPRDDELTVPPPVASHLLALARGDVDSLVASFENGATLRDPAGETHVKKSQGGTLRAFYERLFESSQAGGPGVEMLKGARADDGRMCALEYTVARLHGKDVTPQPGLAVYERGESGLLRAARLYHDY
jgi:ketosteroid isomerase-like protein